MQNVKYKIGVLAVQGSFIEHIEALKVMDRCVIPVKSVEDIRSIDGLIIPGGESTTISKLMRQYDIDKEVILRAKNGMPIYGTCAGMILLSKNIDYSLKIMNINVDRNAYGRQLDSYVGETRDVNEEQLKVSSLQLFCIRAPIITNIGPNILVLAKFQNIPMLVRENNLLASSFHPELTNDTTVYRYFIEMIKDSLSDVAPAM